MIMNENWNVECKTYESIMDNTNQQKLSIFFAKFYNIQDLTYICEDVLKQNIPMDHRDIDEPYKDIYRYSNFDVILEIKDILVMDIYPAIRFIEITAIDLLVFNTYSFRYQYTPCIYEILNKIVSDAYNFSMYCSDQLENEKINKAPIYEVYANQIDTIFKIDNYNYLQSIEFKYMINEVMKHNIFNRKARFIKVFSISEHVECEIVTVTDHIMKLSVYPKWSTHKSTIYLDRLTQGKGQLELIIDFLIKINNNQ